MILLHDAAAQPGHSAAQPSVLLQCRLANEEFRDWIQAATVRLRFICNRTALPESGHARGVLNSEADPVALRASGSGVSADVKKQKR
jgi:hypothetical protein